MAPPLNPDEPTARAWLEAELTNGEYRLVENLLARVMRIIDDWFSSLGEGVSTWSGTTAWAVLIAAVLVALLIVLRAVHRPVPRVRVDDAAEDEVVTARLRPEEHDRLAAEALAAGDADLALVHTVRALIVRADARGLLTLRDGLTVLEATTTLAGVRPALRGDLERVSNLFAYARYAVHEEHESRCTPDDVRFVADVGRRVLERAGAPA